MTHDKKEPQEAIESVVKIEYFTAAINARDKTILNLEITVAWQSDQIKYLKKQLSEKS